VLDRDRGAALGGGGPQLVHWGVAVTIYGVCAVTFMMTMYALERRRRAFVLAFACGCVLSSVYGFWSGAWPFGVVELVWSGIAVRRYLTAPAEPV
jgi:glucose dehydrogenase